MQARNRREFLFAAYVERLKADYPSESVEWIASRAEALTERELEGNPSPPSANEGISHPSPNDETPSKNPEKRESKGQRSLARKGMPTPRRPKPNAGTEPTKKTRDSKLADKPRPETRPPLVSPKTKPDDSIVWILQVFGVTLLTLAVALWLGGSSVFSTSSTSGPQSPFWWLQVGKLTLVLGSAIMLIAAGIARRNQRRKVQERAKAEWKTWRENQLLVTMERLRERHPTKSSQWVRQQAESIVEKNVRQATE
ncbi:hypothetical protein OAF82_00105 [bacterium]|nr:hypothetical protein [bacterium]